MVSSKSGSGSLSVSVSVSSTRDPRHSTRDDRQGRPRFRHRRSLFKVSGFQGFIQIGVGIAIGIGIDHLTTKHTGWHCSGFYPQIYTDYADFWGHRSGFLGTPGGIPDFHEVSCVSWFHLNRGRDRYRYRDRYSLTPSHPHRLTPSQPHSLTPSQPPRQSEAVEKPWLVSSFARLNARPERKVFQPSRLPSVLLS